MALSQTTILYDEADGVATLTLNRPEQLNAFTATMCAEVAAAWAHIRNSSDVRCVVLTGAGDRAFCTGIDRNEIPTDGPPFDPFTYDDPGRQLGPRANECWKPIVAAVNGMACGGAFYLLGEVDFIVAAEHATFFDPHVTFGMSAIYEPTLMLARMPFGELSRMMLLGAHERISAARACSIGLVTEVLPAGDLLDGAQALAAQIASQPPLAVQTTVRSLWAARELSRQQMLSVGGAFLSIGTRPDALNEGQQAFASGARAKPRVR